MINSLPTNRASEISEVVEPTISPSEGIFPVFTAEPREVFDLGTRPNIMEGFLGNKDYILLPTGSGSISYFGSSDVIQPGWPILPSDIDPAVDQWGGVMMTSNGVIYAIGIDRATIPDTVYTVSINSAGAITNIGNAQFTDANMDGPGSGSYFVDGTNQGSSNIYRASDLIGNLFIAFSTPGVTAPRIQEISITDGSMVGVPVVLPKFNKTDTYIHYRTPNGTGCGTFQIDADTGLVEVTISGDKGSAIARMEFDTGIGGIAFSTNANLVPIMWKGAMTLGSGQSLGDVVGVRSFNKLLFDAVMDEIAIDLGVSSL